MFERLLIVAEWCCGAEVGARVFEPLVADWQHEWRQAQRGSARAQIRVLLSGTSAFACVLASTVVRQLCLIPTPEITRRALAMFACAVVAGVLAQTCAWLIWLKVYPPAASAHPPTVELLDVATLFNEAMPPATALAVLLTLSVLRNDARRPLLSAQLLLAGTIATFVAVSWIAPTTNKLLMEANIKRAYARAVQDERAGRVTYPGSAVRALERASNAGRRPAPTEAQIMTFVRELPGNMTFSELIAAMRTDAPSKHSQEIASRLRGMAALPLLTFSLGLMGIGLKRLGPDPVRAIVWWVVAWFITASPMGIVVRRTPIGRFWFLVAMFAATGVALLLFNPVRPTRPTSPTRPA